jgi:hypothetical protein
MRRDPLTSVAPAPVGNPAVNAHLQHHHFMSFYNPNAVDREDLDDHNKYCLCGSMSCCCGGPFSFFYLYCIMRNCYTPYRYSGFTVGIGFGALCLSIFPFVLMCMALANYNECGAGLDASCEPCFCAFDLCFYEEATVTHAEFMEFCVGDHNEENSTVAFTCLGIWLFLVLLGVRFLYLGSSLAKAIGLKNTLLN